MAQFPNTTAADGIWTLKKVRRAILGGNWPEVILRDQFFANTTLLLQGDTSNESMLYNAFGDASTNAHDITPVGGVHGTPFSPYNESWSVQFDGSGDYLRATDAVLAEGTDDFTLECWFWIPSSYTPSLNDSLFAHDTTPGYQISWQTSGFCFMSNGSTRLLNTNTLTTDIFDAWHHIAYTRVGNTLYGFLDGNLIGTSTDATVSTNFTNTTIDIGVNRGGTGYVEGYISNLRIVKGTALYTFAFTPPTEPLTAISGTSLLTCQSNRSVDNSSNDHTITVSGDPEIKGFSPFADTDTVTGSGYFDGNSSYLSAPWSVMPTGTEDFTIEYWIYETDTVDTSYGVLGFRSTASENFLIYYGFPTAGYYLLFDDTEIQVGATGGKALNQWSHHAIVRNGDAFTYYIDGQVHGTGTYAGKDVTKSFTNALIGGVDSGGTRELINANLANVRIVKGTAIYTSAFTPPTSPLTAVSGTSLLTLQNRGANRNIGFIDSSHPTREITRNGNVTQGSFSPFSQDEGKWGNYFDGTSDYLSLPSSSSFYFGTADFTIEMWFWTTNKTSDAGRRRLFKQHGSSASATNHIELIIDSTSGGIVFFANANVISGSTAVDDGAWHHVALVRNSGTTTLYIDGSSEGSVSDTTDYNVSTTPAPYIGSYDGSLADWDGYISNLRVVKGTAVYTSTFTPSTTPLTAITNTSLLTCQSNRFVDNSSNAHSITVNGDTKVVPFSPFAPSTAYNPATKGGSGYFDGSGDFLAIPDSTDFDFGTGDFTWEAWIQTNVNVNYQSIVGQWDGGNAWGIHTNNSGTITYFTTTSAVYIGSITVTDNAWHHIAITRQSGTIRLFVDGVSDGSSSDTNTVGDTGNVRIGSLRTGYERYFAGYISNVRLVKGTAVYTSTFTPPTAPLTEVSGTSLLCNFTNAGIYDGTGRNVLETVGNAQVDTAVKKYGTGSMQFDGTGDYLKAVDGDSIGEADFTIEGWVNFNSVSQDAFVSTRDATGSSNTGVLFAAYQSKLRVFTAGLFQLTSTTTLSTGTWYYVAMVRSGGTSTLFVNGVAEDTYADSNNYTSTRIDVGGDISNAYFLDGYIDDLRITKGVARYTANFTPPAAVLPKQ